MGLGKKTIDDENYCGKKVLVRCDFNVPMKDGVITNENRINAALPTIQKLINDGAKVILCSHLGKPKNGPEAKFSLAPVAKALSAKLGKDVVFADDDNVVGDNAKAAVAAMNNGDVVLLQNTRFRKEETKNVPAFSEDLASLADAYVDDAFGSCHRAHCSTAGVTDYIKDTAVGYLMEKEIRYLGNAVNDPVRPFTAILGGAKVADKLNVISNLLEKGSRFLVSSLRKRVFCSSTTSPSFIAATAALAFSPTTVSSSAKTTGCPSSSERRTAQGARLNLASGPFFGLPRWLHRITLPPSATSFLMVGRAATMRLSLVMTPSFMGTLKSTRTSTRLPFTSMSSIVFLLRKLMFSALL